MAAEVGRQPQLWVVDHQDLWRGLSVAALRRAGFAIQDYKDYEELLSASDHCRPDLLLLGCIGSHVEEKELLRALARRGWQVLVLASSLSVEDLREFFHAGAIDVVTRPRTSAELLAVVAADLASTPRKRSILAN